MFTIISIAQLFYFKNLFCGCIFVKGICFLCLNGDITFICQCKCLTYIYSLSRLDFCCIMINCIIIILWNSSLTDFAMLVSFQTYINHSAGCGR